MIEISVKNSKNQNIQSLCIDEMKYARILCVSGKYECRCPAYWNGVNCEKFDEYFEGGIGSEPHLTTTPVHIDIQKQQCIINRCNEKAGNAKCDVSFCLD